MKKSILIWLSPFFILLSFSFVFAETSIKAEVNKKNISTDEVVTYKLVISSSEVKLPLPQTPKFEGFKVVSVAQSNSTAFSQGKPQVTLSYAFILVPLKTGKIKIPPASIKVSNKNYSSDAFEVEVKQGKRVIQSPKTPSKKGMPSSLEPEVVL